MALDPDKITFFAKTDARGTSVPFGIKARDRQRHMYVIGKTGMGKSTLLENMAAQDIMNGEGMAFIDPHGSAIETLLHYVPEHRLDDVVYFAPFDMENPISFNMMEDVGADTRHLVVSGLMSTFKKIWEDAWSARMEYILTNALLALIEYPDTTLLSVNRMLADKAYRDKVVDHVKDPAVKAYWVDEFASYTERFAAEALPAIQNKIGQFTGNPLIRNIIGQTKSSFDVREMMDNKKILLVNLSKGLVGETNADLLGSMLITRIYLGAMSRADLPPEKMKKMPNFYFYVDEFQSFANSTFANILSEARKYHLNLIIAHQYVAQMEEAIRDAVFGNVGTTVTFRVGPFDAEVLERVFEPKFLAADLINLGPYQIYLSLMIDGAGSQPFSAATLPPVETPPVSHREMVIARSRKNYTKPRVEVEDAVNNLHSPKDRIDAAIAGTGGNKGGFTKPAFGQKVGEPPRPKKPKKPQPQSQNNSAHQAQGAQPPRPLQQSNGGANHQPRPPQARPNTQQSAPPRNTSDRPRPQSERQDTKPPHKSEKSLDDLRSILKGMTPAESADKSTDRKDVKEKTPSSNTGSTQKKPISGSANKRLAVQQPQKNNSSEKDSGSHLKSALASVLSEVSTPKKNTEERKPAIKKEQPEKPLPKKVVTDSRSSRSEQQTKSKHPQPQKIQQQKKPDPAQPEKTPQPPAQSNDDISKQMKELEALEKNFEQRADIPQQRQQGDPLDPKKLERMMRVPNSDKTPFK